ncbi:MAG: mechanosensitive ion channel family protein [Arcticibacter sp.]
MIEIQRCFNTYLADWGVASELIPYITLFCNILLIALLAYLLMYIAKWATENFIHAFFKRTSTKWDDIIIEFKLLNNLARLIPVLILKALAPLVFINFPEVLPVFVIALDLWIIVVMTNVVLSFLKAAEYILSSSPLFKSKPVASYFQLARLVVYIAVGILMLSILMGKSPVYFLSAFGAMTAILLLIFKDTILGLVASVQISANDMVRVGDWVEMPKFNADGSVVAMNLNTVKISNWDKTVTTVPTYYFITDSFKNWRGMQESGGRRIKRAIHINIRSIKFVDPEMRERFKKFYLIRDFVERRELEINEYNMEHDVDTTELINGRRMTNIGVFRHYTQAFLQHHKNIRKDMTLMVRQLPPDDRGVPVEIYCFTATVVWAEYEGIQSDIFDHLFAAAKHFDLEIFQAPSGSDIVLAGEKLGGRS